MKDIKSLYLTAKLSGKRNDITEYTECIHELFEHYPSDYVSNIEYIIKSSIGLSTLKPFIEKYGLSIALYDDIIGILESCSEKCNDKELDSTSYNEMISYLESFRDKYKNCFMMFESLIGDLSDIEYFEEKSHGKLKYDFRLVIDLMTGHKCRLVYDLPTNIERIATDTVPIGFSSKYAMSEIKRRGDTDHKSSGQKLLAIVDLRTNTKLKEIYCTGIHNSHYNYNDNVFMDRIGDERYIKKLSKDPNSGVYHLCVGEIDHNFNWKSTFAPANNIVNRNNKDRLGDQQEALSREYLSKRDQMGLYGRPWRRGTKSQNLTISSDYNGNFQYNQNSPTYDSSKEESRLAKEINWLNKQKEDLKLKYEKNPRHSIEENERYNKELKEIEEKISSAKNNLSKFKSKQIRDIRKSKLLDHKDLVSEYVDIYYSFNNNGIQNRKLLSGMIEKFNEFAIPDILITAKSISENSVDTALNFIFNEYSSYQDVFQYIYEAAKDITTPDNSYMVEMKSFTPESIVNKMKERNFKIFRESVLLGTDEGVLEYTEDELNALANLISFKEYKITHLNDPDDIIKLQNEIYSLYEEFDGILSESGEVHNYRDIHEDVADGIIPLLPQQDGHNFIKTESLFDTNTQNKKNGTVPEYLARNHDLGYGEDENIDKDKSDNKVTDSIEDFRRPSAGGDPQETSTDDEYGKSDKSEYDNDSNNRAINNYYYYNYTNSLNKNSNSFNKDNSTHDDHTKTSKIDNHSTNYDNSVKNNSHRINDDHSSKYDNSTRSNSNKTSNDNHSIKISDDHSSNKRYNSSNIHDYDTENSPIHESSNFYRGYVSITEEQKNSIINRINNIISDIRNEEILTKYSLYGWNVKINDKDIESSFIIKNDGHVIFGIPVYKNKPDIEFTLSIKGLDQYDLMDLIKNNYPEYMERLSKKYDLNSRLAWSEIQWNEKIFGYDKTLDEITDELSRLIKDKYTMINNFEFAGDNDSGPIFDGVFDNMYIIDGINLSNICYESDITKDLGDGIIPLSNNQVYDFIESGDYYLDKNSYDKHIKQIWFIKSDDNVDNCCISLSGYDKPMRGRSTMIALKNINGKWNALIKRKPDGEWEFPGGGWDRGEQPIDTAIRETQEETQYNVKDVKRVGTQIEYNPNKFFIPLWVKKHVKNSDDWWYGYYSAIFIGKEDGEFTGHIDEEDYEDTFKWKPLEFIAKKIPADLINCIEKYIQMEFKEYANNEFLSESVNVTNKKFDKAYKAVFNYDNGHLLKITYSLHGCEITNVGLSKAMIDHVASVAEEVNKGFHRSHRYIRSFMMLMKGIITYKKEVKNRKKLITKFLNERIGDVGYLDFQAKNCKIIEIYDLYDNKKIEDEVSVVGLYSARYFKSSKCKILSKSDLDKVHKKLESNKTKFHVSKHIVGGIEKYPTFMSTYWDDNDDHTIVDLSNKVIDSDERDRSEDIELDNLSDLIGDLEAKGFHVSDEEVQSFITKYRSDDKYIQDTFHLQDNIKKNETIKLSREFSLFGVKFKLPDISNGSDDIKKEADEKMLKILNNSDKIKDIEKDILDEERKIGEKDDTDETRKERIKKYLSKSSIKSYKSTDKGNALFEIDIPHNKDLICAWIEHGLWITSNGKAKSFNEIEFYESVITEDVGDADDLKPKSDHPIKDTLTDIDRELVKKQQAAKKKVQELQNTGRIITKPVVRSKQWISKTLSNWKDANETNIKEKMADPHSRRNLLYAAKTAIKYGSLAKAGLLFNPYFLFLAITRKCRRNSKEFRIRNEMIEEIKTEIEILDAKIEDAATDKNAKYKLMRIRNELKKKLVRVGGEKDWKKLI